MNKESSFTTRLQEIEENLEKFDLLETINNVGNDEVFTPRKTCDLVLDALPKHIWNEVNYKWLIPCSKNGVFEREIALRLDKGLKDIIPNIEQRRKHILQNMIFSLGLTKFTALVARRTVYYCVDANRAKDPNNQYEGFAIGNGTWFSTPEGNILNPIGEHCFIDAKGKETKKCIFCGVSKDSNYLKQDAELGETYAYEFIHYPKDILLEKLQDRFFNGDRNMKFDVVIGNPPYQMSDGGGTGSSAFPIYNEFIDRAKELESKYISFIIPSRWMIGGKGLDDFRNQMISDKSIVYLHDFVNGENLFPNNSIKGGICFFLRDNEHNGKTDHYLHLENNDIIHSKRYLQNEDCDIFFRFPEFIEIYNKVWKNKSQTSFAKFVSARKPYGLAAEFLENPIKFGKPNSIRKDSFKNCISIHGLEKLKRVIRYVDKDYPFDKKEGIDKYSIFMPKAYGCGIIGEVPSTPILSTPNSVCTETYLRFGPFDTKEERDNCYSYVKTKFFRFMVGIRKGTQNTSKDTYLYVPLVSFDESWDDEKLYKLFELSDDDIKFIEDNIQEVDWDETC